MRTSSPLAIVVVLLFALAAQLPAQTEETRRRLRELRVTPADAASEVGEPRSLIRGNRPVEAARVLANLYDKGPNPRWALSPKETDELGMMLSEMLPAGKKVDLPVVPGYGGISVEMNDPGLSPYTWMGFFRGQVLARSEDGRNGYLDPGRRIERWLARTARGKIDEATAREIEEGAGE